MVYQLAAVLKSQRLLQSCSRRSFPILVQRSISSSFNAPFPGERLRVAIVGGGVAGLSTALHLAELVERGLVASPIDVYVGSPKEQKVHARDIGVGVWSTALLPFQESYRPSHQLVWEDWMRSGDWLGGVGYKTPKGHWLAQSKLPTSGSFQDFPGLLFLRERDLLEALQRAVHLEQVSAGTIQIHSGPKPTGVVEETNSKTWSAQLELDTGDLTERDYHLIIGADGTQSSLRQRYGGHSMTRTRLTGTNVFSSPNSVQKRTKEHTSWNAMGQAEANAIEDRNYSVLRGNAPLTNDDVDMDGVSFQTWGEGQSMRFATVPLSYPVGYDGERVEKQVWFATTSDPNIVGEKDAAKRKEKIIQAFSSWHGPITTIMESTPADEILMEGAIAHKHCVGPVLDVHRLLRELHHKAPPSAGPGPVMVFVGDSFMTVDPILAQGFTMALEGAHALLEPIESACWQSPDNTNNNPNNLAFDPYALRTNLQDRHDRRNHRLVALLRATELVQALGQPQASLLGFLFKNLMRPAMRLTPNAIKAPIFDAMVKYSLGK